MDSTISGDGNPTPSSGIPFVVVVPEDDQGNISPASLVAKIFNDPEARTMLRKAILSDNSGEAPKAHHPRAENARALKAQETATTLSNAQLLKGHEGQTVIL